MIKYWFCKETCKHVFLCNQITYKYPMFTGYLDFFYHFMPNFSKTYAYIFGVLVEQGTRGNFLDLMSPEYRRTSLQMWLMWFVTAFSYYGMVLASAEILQIHNSGENSKGRSPLTIYLPWTLNEHLSMLVLCVPGMCQKLQPHCSRVQIALFLHLLCIYSLWIWILQMLKAVNVIC